MSHPSSTWPLESADPAATDSGRTFVEGVDLELDADGDVALDSDVYLTVGIDAAVQGVLIRIRLIRGEWFLDLDEGVPYFERDGVVDPSEALLGQKFNDARARAAMLEAIEAAPGVAEVVHLGIRYDGASRKMLVEFQVRSDLGELSAVTTTET